MIAHSRVPVAAARPVRARLAQRTALPAEVPASRRSWITGTPKRAFPTARIPIRPPGGRGDGPRLRAPKRGAGHQAARSALWPPNPGILKVSPGTTAPLACGPMAARRHPGEVAARRRFRITAHSKNGTPCAHRPCTNHKCGRLPHVAHPHPQAGGCCDGQRAAGARNGRWAAGCRWMYPNGSLEC